jgi:hypothetical protein
MRFAGANPLLADTLNHPPPSKVAAVALIGTGEVPAVTATTCDWARLPGLAANVKTPGIAASGALRFSLTGISIVSGW